MDNEIKIELQQKPKQDLVSGDYFKTKLKCHINQKKTRCLQSMWRLYIATEHQQHFCQEIFSKIRKVFGKVVAIHSSAAFLTYNLLRKKCAKFYIFLLITQENTMDLTSYFELLGFSDVLTKGNIVQKEVEEDIWNHDKQGLCTR